MSIGTKNIYVIFHIITVRFTSYKTIMFQIMIFITYSQEVDKLFISQEINPINIRGSPLTPSYLRNIIT